MTPSRLGRACAAQAMFLQIVTLRPLPFLGLNEAFRFSGGHAFLPVVVSVVVCRRRVGLIVAVRGEITGDDCALSGKPKVAAKVRTFGEASASGFRQECSGPWRFRR